METKYDVRQVSDTPTYAVFMTDDKGHTSQVGSPWRDYSSAKQECSKWREREAAATRAKKPADRES